MRKQFELTNEQLKKLLDACKPTPVMFLSGGIPMGGTPQEKANRAWKELGEKLGFEYMTVVPSSKGQKYFTAEVKE